MPMKKTLTLAIAAALVAAACGTAADDLPTDLGSDGIRVVAVTMSEFHFSPAVVEVEQGETVRFVVTNDGVADHEFELSNDAAIEEHLEGGHDEHDEGLEDMDMADKLSLAPGETGELTVTFDGEDGWVVCLIPGHYEAGMRMEIVSQK
jgi:uncharacterized cupredoxin-like copper-binding protein